MAYASKRFSSSGDRLPMRALRVGLFETCLVALRLGLGALAVLASALPAAALDISCIESSRYVYLMKLFGGDSARFAAYFQLSPGNLPAPSACRAARVSGNFEHGLEDATKLMTVIAQNGGWLDTIYLDSGGGNVNSGVLIALLTRDFWLKTRIGLPGATLVYDPDFGPIGDAKTSDAGRSAFDTAAAAVATTYPKSHRPFCASACTYSLAAGIDRHGIAQVHRPRNFTSESIEQRTVAAGAEALMMSIYKKMDAGDSLMAATRETATQTTTSVVVSRYPRFVEDAILDRCKSDDAQLDDLDALLRFARGARGNGLASARGDTLDNALSRLTQRRQAVAQCVSAIYEKERLAAFARYCPGGCNLEAVKQKVISQFQELKG